MSKRCGSCGEKGHDLFYRVLPGGKVGLCSPCKRDFDAAGRSPDDPEDVKVCRPMGSRPRH